MCVFCDLLGIKEGMRLESWGGGRLRRGLEDRERRRWMVDIVK